MARLQMSNDQLRGSCHTVFHGSYTLPCNLYSVHAMLGLLYIVHVCLYDWTHDVHVLMGLLFTVHVSFELFYSAHILIC